MNIFGKNTFFKLVICIMCFYFLYISRNRLQHYPQPECGLSSVREWTDGYISYIFIFHVNLSTSFIQNANNFECGFKSPGHLV